ncbi:MAG TPA: DUF805 domain-containing protein [Rhizomicrobium sp.]|nr:DUF805 domain-containing protein [Rhizomicrobium sp.]
MDVNAIVELFRRTVTEHYFDTKGRVGRKEFWWWVGACVAVFIVAAIVDAVLGFGVLRPLLGLALLLPMTGMGIRRLQDTGTTGNMVTLAWVLCGLSALSQVFALLMGLSGPFGALAAVSLFFTLGWLFGLIGLASLVIAVVLIYHWVQPGASGENSYGPPPPDFDPMTPTPTKAG